MSDHIIFVTDFYIGTVNANMKMKNRFWTVRTDWDWLLIARYQNAKD
jgi:hypothetical protein